MQRIEGLERLGIEHISELWYYGGRIDVTTPRKYVCDPLDRYEFVVGACHLKKVDVCRLVREQVANAAEGREAVI